MLLHIGDPARWTTVDPGVVALSALAFVMAAALIWAPALRHRSLQRRLGRPLMVGAMLVAVFPSILPYDHLFSVGGPPGAHASADEATHAAHCHTAPGSCADAPVSSGAGQFLTSEPLLIIPALTALVIILSIPMLAGVSTRPVLRPPMLAS